MWTLNFRPPLAFVCGMLSALEGDTTSKQSKKIGEIFLLPRSLAQTRSSGRPADKMPARTEDPVPVVVLGATGHQRQDPISERGGKGITHPRRRNSTQETRDSNQNRPKQRETAHRRKVREGEKRTVSNLLIKKANSIDSQITVECEFAAHISSPGNITEVGKLIGDSAIRGCCGPSRHLHTN